MRLHHEPVERPTYSVESEYESIQIRSYEPQLIAQVTVQGERNEALSQGFRLLADYIFGNTISSGKIDMTAPVVQQQGEVGWTVHFIMPKEYTIESLPKPNNKKVQTVSIPERRFITIEYFGPNTEENVREHQ